MPAPDRLDNIAVAILTALLSDHAKLRELAREAQAVNEDPRDYIAKWVWAEAHRVENLRT